MGSKQAKFEEARMEEMEAITSLNRTEIYHTYNTYRQIYEDFVPEGENMIKSPILLDTGFINPDLSLPTHYIIDNIPVLKVNPLNTRICDVFSSDREGETSFLEFLDMVSAFNTETSLQDRTVYAFRVYDMDGDGVISRADLEKIVGLFTDNNMSQATKDELITGVFKEVNKEANCDGLSTKDFGYAISRSPDFQTTFSFRL